jgi:PilZ domain
MDKPRIAPRKRVLKGGTIEFSGESIPCTVRNISASGAALEVTTVLWFPDRFTLGVESDGLRRPCHIVWRKEKRIGVAFE